MDIITELLIAQTPGEVMEILRRMNDELDFPVSRSPLTVGLGTEDYARAA
jgi:hypothetical protein